MGSAVHLNPPAMDNTKPHLPDALTAAGTSSLPDLTQRLLLWQISQLDYICGSVYLDLGQLISTINSMFGFVCSNRERPVLDALVDEAGRRHMCPVKCTAVMQWCHSASASAPGTMLHPQFPCNVQAAIREA